MAFRELSASFLFSWSNFSRQAFSRPKARTTFCPVSISSTKAVCSPRASDCARNMEYVREAMNLAINRERGVSTTTVKAIHHWSRSMKYSVPAMVTTPVNSWVKPSSRPSAKVSASAMMRETISPWGCASR